MAQDITDEKSTSGNTPLPKQMMTKFYNVDAKPLPEPMLIVNWILSPKQTSVKLLSKS